VMKGFGRIAAMAMGLVLLLMLAAPAAAQTAEVSLDRGPASELYLRKRPATPERLRPPRIRARGVWLRKTSGSYIGAPLELSRRPGSPC